MLALLVIAVLKAIVRPRGVALKVIAVPMLVVPKENAETQRVPSDLAVRAMTVVLNAIASSHANERIGLATERRSVP